MYTRILQTKLCELSTQWSIISVTGPRQSGKTTLCKMAFPEYDYINLERSSTCELIREDMEGYLLEHSRGLIIDEAQNLPELFSILQVLVDEHKDSRFVLSGSSDFLLMQRISQSLAGRVAVLRLLPLSLRELGGDADMSVDEVMWRGFYPAVWGDKKSPGMVYDSYVATYIERDVRQILNVKDRYMFRRFLTLLASRVGNMFVASSIGSELGVDYKTVQSWLSILETSYTAFTLQPFYRNIGKRLTKTSKIYFYDVGLVCHLLGIRDAQQLAHHPLRGAVFENMVVCEMLKDCYNQARKNNLMYYRDTRQEVDVLQEEADGLHAVEIKSASCFHPDLAKSITYLQSLLGEDLLSSKIIYTGREELHSQFSGLVNYQSYFRKA